jgi:hypothetical protein
MRTGASFLLVLAAFACSSPRPLPVRTPAPAPTTLRPIPVLRHRPAPAPAPITPVFGYSEGGRLALKIGARPAGEGACRVAEAHLLELSGSPCVEPDATQDFAGRCIQADKPVEIRGATRLCGTVLTVAVEDEGDMVALASNREGLLVRTKRDEALVPLENFAARHARELDGWVEPTSLLFFSEDRRALFLVPLARSPVVIDLATRTETTATPAQAAEIERRSLIKARIRLLAKDDRLKEVGLRWALTLGDTRNIEAVARIAATTKDPVLAELAGEILEGYRRWLDAASAQSDPAFDSRRSTLGAGPQSARQLNLSDRSVTRRAGAEPR